MRRPWYQQALAFAGAASLLLVGALAASPRPPLEEGMSWSELVTAHDGKLLRLTLSADDKYRLATKLAGVSRPMREAIVLREDRYFRYHPGINPIALARAALSTVIHADAPIGASTITMQLARVREKLHTRTIAGKLHQMWRALVYEWHYDKDEILEAYLNLAPFGGNIEGIAAASLIYFDKNARELTLGEAFLLAVLPQRPSARAPRPSGGAYGTGHLAARDRLLADWLAAHPEDRARREELVAKRPAHGVKALPFLAPHAVDALLGRSHSRGTITATIDLGLQTLLERKVKAYVAARRDIGLHNASALLVDARTMTVLAMVGSADYHDPAIAGQVNGAYAKRSPGSTLKPFIYALGFDQGLIHPRSILKDAPTRYGGWDPDNHDHDFVGPISVAKALVKSRNLPAVEVASQLREPDLYDFLGQAGIHLPRSREYYGLALALGGAELSMAELVELYATLYHGGVRHRLRLTGDEPLKAEGRLLSREASLMTRHMLARNPRPAVHYQSQWLKSRRAVAWKTGTSFAFRDAWAVGLDGPYVLAVWIGNFDGSSNPAFIGQQMAGPLFFSILDALPPVGATDADALGMPPNVTLVDVCPVSGRLPGPYCRHTVKTEFIPGVSPITRCDVHRSVLVDRESGRRACSKSGVTSARHEVFEFWPSDLLALFRRAGVPRRTPPPWHEACELSESHHEGQPPRIVSPTAGVIYTARLDGAAPSDRKLAFRAIADADAKTLHWFLDQRYIGRSEVGGHLFWQPEPGRYVVKVVDDLGRVGAPRELIVALEGS